MNVARLSCIPMIIATTLLASCASMPGDGTVATNTPTRECKVVRIYTASDAIRNETRGTTLAQDDLTRSEGVAGVAKTLQRPEPAPLRNRGGGTSLSEHLMQGC